MSACLLALPPRALLAFRNGAKPGLSIHKSYVARVLHTRGVSAWWPQRGVVGTLRLRLSLPGWHPSQSSKVAGSPASLETPGTGLGAIACSRELLCSWHWLLPLLFGPEHLDITDLSVCLLRKERRAKPHKNNRAGGPGQINCKTRACSRTVALARRPLKLVWIHFWPAVLTAIPTSTYHFTTW